MSDVPLAFKIYLWAVGGCVLFAGCFQLRRHLRLLLRGDRIHGTLVGWTREGSIDDGPSYYHRIVYRNSHGEQVEFESRMGGSGKSDEIGTTLPLLLIPGTPDTVELARPFWLAAAPLIMLAFGAAIVVLPLVQ